MDEGEIGSMGMCVGHTEAGDFKFGEGTPAKVYKMIPSPFFFALPQHKMFCWGKFDCSET